MGKRRLGNLTGKARSFCSPIAEGRPKTVDSYITTHSPQQHLHCHVTHHCPTIARKHKLVLPYLSHLFEHCYCGVGERHTVFAAALHSLRSHGPTLGLEVHLVPTCTDHLPCPGRGQDREFERLRRDPNPLSKIGHEQCHLGVAQRRVMLNSTDFRNVGQKVLEVAAKSGGIFAIAITTRLCPIEDCFDPSPHPPRRLGLSRPQRL